MTRVLPAVNPVSVGFGRRFVVAICTGSVLNPINSSIIAVALVAIGQAFGVGADRTAWLVSALYLATAVGQPTMGKLADRVGPRRVYLAGLALVAAGGLIGFLANAFGWVVLARVIIGLGTSAAYPVAITMVRQQSERLHQSAPGGVLGALAVAGQVTMAVGPPLGGLLIAAGGWRSIFLVNIPLALIGAALALLWLPTDEKPTVESSAGALHFVTGLTRMLVGNRALVATYLRYALTFLVTYSFVYGWTQWLEQSAGLSASAAGLVLMPSFVVAAVVSAIVSRHRAIWLPLLIGAVLLTVGSAALLMLTTSTPVWVFVVISVIFGVQNAMMVVANQAAMYAQAPAADTGTAAGLLRTFMYLGAIGAASLISVTYRDRATDASLHSLAVVLVGASILVVVMTVLNSRSR
ncbi:MFS transporter [Fodinicola acaciae]|uniref:MFS transporter n=1 Tax=Fodinicola acaciae TaxID=2681555 RepID=UPI0013D3DEAB|nr:MFS transporter [Fodinicola acaciae]